MTLRSTLTALLLVGLSPHLGAQTVTIEAEPKTTLLDGKTMIKAHPLGIIFGDYTLSGERVLTPGLSVGMAITIDPGDFSGVLWLIVATSPSLRSSVGIPMED